MQGIHDAMGTEAQTLGGFLRCETCRREQRLGSVAMKLRNGWPRCCGYTQRQIDAGEVPA